MQGFCLPVFETLQFESRMKPKAPSGKSQFQLFQAHFDQILNHNHPLIVLANKYANAYQVNADSTVKEENIAHPTDAKLYHKAILKLSRAANDRNVKLRQTYRRVTQKLAIKVGRYAHARQCLSQTILACSPVDICSEIVLSGIKSPK